MRILGLMNLPSEPPSHPYPPPGQPGARGPGRVFTMQFQGKSGVLGLITVVLGVIVALTIALVAGIAGLIISAVMLVGRSIAGIFRSTVPEGKAEPQPGIIDVESSVIPPPENK